MKSVFAPPPPSHRKQDCTNRITSLMLKGNCVVRAKQINSNIINSVRTSLSPYNAEWCSARRRSSSYGDGEEGQGPDRSSQPIRPPWTAVSPYKDGSSSSPLRMAPSRNVDPAQSEYRWSVRLNYHLSFGVFYIWSLRISIIIISFLFKTSLILETHFVYSYTHHRSLV